MADKLTKEDIRQAFFDMATEMEREYGDWKNLPETDADKALEERIINMSKGNVASPIYFLKQISKSVSKTA